MSIKFVVSHLEQQLGPFEEHEIKALWVQGEILPIDYVYDEEIQDWVLLTERFDWARSKPEQPKPAANPTGPADAVGEDGPPPLDVAKTNKNESKNSGNLRREDAIAADRDNELTDPRILDLGTSTSITSITNVEDFDFGSVQQPPESTSSVSPASPTNHNFAQNLDLNLSPSLNLNPSSHSNPNLNSNPIPNSNSNSNSISNSSSISNRNSNSNSSSSSNLNLNLNLNRNSNQTPEISDAHVNLVGGVGEIELALRKPGKVELCLDESTSHLMLHKSLQIHIKPADPVEIQWTLPEQQTTGQEAEVVIRAYDEYGNLCDNYEDQFQLKVQSPNSHGASKDLAKDFTVELRDGEARLKLSHTKSELWKLTLHYNGPRALRLPTSHTLEWQPGPAAKLILDGPQEYTAGHPMKVRVQAVDAYGNLAKTFSGTVVLEVKAS
ncbi:MAG: hypothetical protein AB7G93_03615 [Bdellovibrionales bacterium]